MELLVLLLLTLGPIYAAEQRDAAQGGAAPFPSLESVGKVKVEGKPQAPSPAPMVEEYPSPPTSLMAYNFSNKLELEPYMGIDSKRETFPYRQGRVRIPGAEASLGQGQPPSLPSPLLPVSDTPKPIDDAAPIQGHNVLREKPKKEELHLVITVQQPCNQCSRTGPGSSGVL